MMLSSGLTLAEALHDSGLWDVTFSGDVFFNLSQNNRHNLSF